VSLVVLDASAAVEALLHGAVGAEVRGRIAGQELHAPYLLEFEVAEALRHSVRRGTLSPDRGHDALDDLFELAIVPYPLGALRERVWELGANVTAYDAAYVALAETLDAPLVTCDGRLARAPGLRARVELFAA
jgi:predicted nucleic acid-binding protein